MTRTSLSQLIQSADPDHCIYAYCLAWKKQKRQSRQVDWRKECGYGTDKKTLVLYGFEPLTLSDRGCKVTAPQSIN